MSREKWDISSQISMLTWLSIRVGKLWLRIRSSDYKGPCKFLFIMNIWQIDFLVTEKWVHALSLVNSDVENSSSFNLYVENTQLDNLKCMSLYY